MSPDPISPFPAEKAQLAKKPGEAQYYLESRGLYFQLSAEEKEGKLLLSETPDSASACILFDWDVTLANAKAIRAMLPREWSESLSRDKYDEIIRATRSKFPEIVISKSASNPYLHGEQIDAVPGLEAPLAYTEFDGLIFDSRQNEISQYRIRIEPRCFFVETSPLLQGPRHSDRSDTKAATNAAVEGKPKKGSTPTAAQRKKAENEKAIEFQKMVQEIISSRPQT